jgi:hypothetical protein
MNTESASAINVSTTTPTHGKALIVGLWLVAIYFVLTSGSSLLSYVALYGGLVPLTPEQEQHIAMMPKFTVVFAAFLMALNLAGGILLALRRKIAFYLLAVSAGLNICSLAFNIFSGAAPAPGVSIAQTIVPYLVLLGILFFVFVLYRKRVLSR